MESDYPIQAWHDLYIMLGTSSATLIGLIFVAASLHLRDLVDNPAFRVRAYHGTLYLLTLLLEAVAILVPQPVPALGVQLCALNLAGLWFPLSSAYSYFYKDKAASQRAGLTMTRTIDVLCGLSARYRRKHHFVRKPAMGHVSRYGFLHHAACCGRLGCLGGRIGHRANGRSRKPQVGFASASPPVRPHRTGTNLCCHPVGFAANDFKNASGFAILSSLHSL